MKWGMVIDLGKCIGCAGCQIACKAANGTPPGVTFARVEVRETGEGPHVRRFPLPLLCMHCAEPPCRDVCPTGATQKRPDGIVFVDAEICIGCKACIMACPYGARYFYDEVSYYFGDTPTPLEERIYRRWTEGTVHKCDFCKDRVDEGLRKGLKPGVDPDATPACVVNCMATARFFGDLDDPESVVSRLAASGRAVQLLVELGTNPQVHYLIPVFRPSLSSEPGALSVSVPRTSPASLPSLVSGEEG